MNLLSPLPGRDFRLIAHEPLGWIWPRATPTCCAKALLRYARLARANPCAAILQRATPRDDLVVPGPVRHTRRQARSPRSTCAARPKSP